jgi:ribosomal protein S18 acetylase RimI-like enzyme
MPPSAQTLVFKRVAQARIAWHEEEHSYLLHLNRNEQYIGHLSGIGVECTLEAEQMSEYSHIGTISYKEPGPIEVRIRRANLEGLSTAYGIVCEYYAAVSVMVREDPAAFEREYFGEGAGIWLAEKEGAISGCIALRHLPQRKDSGEIKRLYVRPQHRGQGVAEMLLHALESYAAAYEYKTLYLDSKKDLMPAIRFYRRHGYEFCERYNDNPQATVFMRKQLK